MKRKDLQFRLKSYLTYVMKAKGRHAIHSPFIFNFILNVIDRKRVYYDFEELDRLRSKMSSDNRWISMNDLGAGSSFKKRSEKRLSDIARQSSSPAVVCEMLYRLAHYYQLHNILELGTNVGMSSLYLALNDDENRLITIEGDSALAALAKENFEKLGASNIKLLEGEFSEILPKALGELERIDLAFVDGNHTEEATVEYFKSILPHIHQASVMVFDDIYWSRGMERAWKKIIQDSRVTISIDWYRLGFVFFRRGIEKQHFVLKQRP